MSDGAASIWVAVIVGVFGLVSLVVAWLLNRRGGRAGTEAAVEQVRLELRELSAQERAEDKAEISRLRELREQDQQTILRLIQAGAANDQ